MYLECNTTMCVLKVCGILPEYDSAIRVTIG